MAQSFENIDKFGQEWMDSSLQSASVVSKGLQELTVEAADYSKKAMETGTAAAEKLASAKSMEKAFEIQADYLKQSYEGFVAQATRMTDLYATIAKDACKPFEATFKNLK
ncbi:phasin family protein [Nitratireductor thuwali]|uniref:Phasin domain-containing protein n=1 Tax=Nitratireductor thuwali TaxID=2267699 RepID=A0ABY5MEE4_9HYPH|nr:hypothetical protein NTH_00251 [Nitratireductor thuwali]